MSLGLRSTGRSDVGHVREGNEDSGFAGTQLIAVADGMGGAAAGEVASTVAIAALAALDEDAPASDLAGALARAVLTANDQLRDLVAADDSLDGMGTTVTAALAVGSRLGLVHVGDSRGYLLRDGNLTQITHDHTFVQSLVDSGQIAPDDAATHPQRHLILRALDGRADLDLDLSVREMRLGDRYLLCTDGLYGVVGDTTIAEVASLPEPEQVVHTLVELALAAGGPDNVTVICADVVEIAPTDSDPKVIGAAADDEDDVRSGLLARSRSAAAKAALLGRRPRSRRTPAEGATSVAAPPKRSWVRHLITPLLAALLLAAVLGGSYHYVRTRYFVGADDGYVTVFRGVPGSVLGVHLNSPVDRAGRLSVLPTYEQRQVTETISASSRTDARRIIRQLATHRLGCPTLAPGPATPTPAGPTASAAPSPAGSPSTRSIPTMSATPVSPAPTATALATASTSGISPSPFTLLTPSPAPAAGGCAPLAIPPASTPTLTPSSGGTPSPALSGVTTPSTPVSPTGTP